MLTKEEREATIERIKSYGDSDLPFYKLLFGSRAPYAMQYTEYLKALKDRILDLCDTSNMIELPRDKDGEVIHVGDTVYEREGAELLVNAINIFENGSNVSVRSGNVYTTYRSDVLTHKKPTENAVLAAQIRAVVRSEISMPNFAVNKLSNIADQIEKLGDIDD